MNCPKCKVDITTMKNVIKKGNHYKCKCGKNITRQKLLQLVRMIKEEYNPQ